FNFFVIPLGGFARSVVFNMSQPNYTTDGKKPLSGAGRRSAVPGSHAPAVRRRLHARRHLPPRFPISGADTSCDSGNHQS
ncbi:hypothetical protein, partial [Alistipes finegoldii]|uniref:hypothetical protein n=1 Tax=Alistipes finegoldii TaxID=214856 RepID=UPI003AAB1899